ncbi:MFS general substrate transporter [Teratosphaeria nubilosa]|uniref:MFS general substrate transporter n=1 Tax=Teratosphaeria nubilosa TaxID=161662 RepID=A0A6G1L2T9_9PEZI|nr:MFS general substrate transporter [Teratosphaeria nubilosa]
MSILLQERSLKRVAQRQLDSLKDSENGGTYAASESSRGDGEEDLYARLPGVEVKVNEDGSKNYVVGWSSPDDHMDPHNWSQGRKIKVVFMLVLIAFVVTAGSSIDSAVQTVAAKSFHVSDVTEALGGTAIYLIGFGIGALIASPASEVFGRYLVYLGTLLIYACWILGAALAPNIGAQIAFRFLAGLSGSAPLTVAGGTISDIFNTREKTWAFPLFAIIGFGGPVLGPVLGAYIPVTGVLDFHWAEWVILITDALVVVLILAFKEETLAPRLLKRKAAYFRKLTGDDRFRSQIELGDHSLWTILKTNFSRPFILALEPIVLAFTLYLSIIYIILFTFLDGYDYIFEMTYGINSGLSNIIFVGLFIGILLQVVLVPVIVSKTNKQLARDGDEGQGTKLDRESRLLFAMYSAPAIPIGLFWMAWTDYASISIWSPMMSSLVIGFGFIAVFLSAYMYIIDSYEMYAASALTFCALVRYLAAGGMTVVGVPMYGNLGTHYTLTILACISIAALPIPYLLYVWGPKLRAKSKYAHQPEGEKE